MMNAKLNYQSKHNENFCVPYRVLKRINTIRRLLLLLAVAAAALSPGEARADNVKYVTFLKPDRTLTSESALQITSGGTTTLSEGSGWFYVSGNVTIDGDLTIETHIAAIILCDGASLTVTGKISCTSEDGFVTLCQSTGTNMGKLTVQSTADDAFKCKQLMVRGGKVTIGGGVTFSGDPTLYNNFYYQMGQFTAGKIINSSKIYLSCLFGTDFIKVGNYQASEINFGNSFITDDATPVTVSGNNFTNFGTINGKKLTPKDVYTVTLPAATAGGTVATDKVKALEGESVTLSFTPSTSYLFTAASYNDGSNHDISPASPTDAAYSQTITMPAHAVTVSATFAPAVASITSGGTTTNYASLQAALDAVGSGETTINILGNISESGTSKGYAGSPNLTILLNSHTVSLGAIRDVGSLTITGPGTLNCNEITNNDGDIEETMTFNGCNVVCKGTDNSFSWMANHVVLKNGANVEWKNAVALGFGSTDFTFEIDKTGTGGSVLKLTNCTIWNEYDQTAHVKAQMDPYVHPSNYLYVNGSTKNNLTLKKRTHTIKVNYGTAYLGSTPITSSTEVRCNNTVKIVANNISGKQFSHWSTSSSGVSFANRNASTTTFTMPDHAVTVTANYTEGLQLVNNLSNASVTFYDGGTTASTIGNFNPASPGASINSIYEGHYVVMHIKFGDDDVNWYWTDKTLLYGMETKGSIGNSGHHELTLIQRDTYTDESSGSTYECYNGSGWYYYQIPSENSVANGYTKSSINGEVVKKFVLSDDDDSDGTKVEQNGTTITVPNGDGWTAEVTLDQVSISFDGDIKKPAITGITVKKGADILITLDAGFDGLLNTYGTNRIGKFPAAETTEHLMDANNYSWFSNNTNPDVFFNVTVPLSVADNTAEKGTAENPWLITSVEEMNLFSKCVNIGGYAFKGEFVKLMNSIDYGTNSTAMADFKPVGFYEEFSIGGTPFIGTFDGGGNTISNLSYTLPVSTTAYYNIGLFGNVGSDETNTPAIINLKMEKCTFDGNDNGGSACGILAGSAIDATVKIIVLTGCKVYGQKNGQPHVGGLIGSVGNSRITGCTISGCTVSNVVTDALGGFGGVVGGVVGECHESEVDNNIVESTAIICDYPNAYDSDSQLQNSGNSVGGIAGYTYAPNIHDNLVKGSTTITDVMHNAVLSKVGAIYGEIIMDDPSIILGTGLQNNYYTKSVTLSITNGSKTTELDGYTPRGCRKFITAPEPSSAETAEFCDMTEIVDDSDPSNPVTYKDGAMMYVKPAVMSLTKGSATSTATMVFDQVTPGTDVYRIDDTTTPETYYYAPEDNITLSAAYGTITEDIRTYQETPTVNVNDDESISVAQTNVTESSCSFGFEMPDNDATVNAVIDKTDWFTIDSNQKQWMSFYHEWTTGGDATAAGTPANYKVTAYNDATKTVSAKTITSIKGTTVTTADLKDNDGNFISFCGVPTLFNCAGGLPEKLKFEPVANLEKPANVAVEFKGVASATDLSGYKNVYVMNGIGDYIFAEDKSVPIAAHRCYVDLGNTAIVAPARLVIVDNSTGIGSTQMDKGDSADWYSIDGRKLSGKPTRKGLYINNGVKVVIK